ncbi:MAG: hypothetical protein DDG60_07460 [Anaerolineae bacterium]|nr:MAG: hypothetical protein DDG60_07460 [Anaerolineae bacterium]
MQRGNLFWGGVLLLLGSLFALQAANIIEDVFGWFWPLFLMLLGTAILVHQFSASQTDTKPEFSIDLNNAARLSVEINHGAGALHLTGDAPPGIALRGVKSTAMNVKKYQSGDTLTVEIEAGPSFLPFLSPEDGTWPFHLTNEVPVAVKINAGVASLDFDFTNTNLEFLGVDMGASSLRVKLPAQAGRTLVAIESGAASIDITIPSSVAARIFLKQGASAQQIDTTRFPQIEQDLYQSPDFEAAPHRAEISLEGGANSITIR